MVQKRGHDHGSHDSRAAVWATLTIAAFPIVTLSLGWIGFDPFRSFLFGGLATLFVLFLEGIIRGRWWISEPAIARVLGDPLLGMRLLILTGLVVLVFQTLVLVGLLTNGSFDNNLVRLILNRQCDEPRGVLFSRLCREAAKPDGPFDLDAVTMALREAAETRFFSGGLVTCAAIPLATSIKGEFCTHGALIRCDRWVIGTITREPISVESIQRTVVGSLRVMRDGTYRIDAWEDDPSAPAWESVGGPIAQMTLTESEQKAAQENIDQSLRSETFRRVMERLQNR